MKALASLIILCAFYTISDATNNETKANAQNAAQQSGVLYGGINSNYTYGNNHVTTFIKAGGPNAAGDLVYVQESEIKRLAHSSFGFGCFAGYMYNFTKIVLMSDISYDSNKLNQSLKHQHMSAYEPGNPLPEPLNTDYSILFKRGNTWSGNVRLGYVIAPSMTIYAKAGLVFSTFHLEYSSEELAKSDKKNLMGIEPGVGVDINMPHGVFFRGEYGFQMFRKFTTTNIDAHLLEPDSKVIYSVSPRYHVIRIGLGYKFSTF